jgi:hypothetical protein
MKSIYLTISTLLFCVFCSGQNVPIDFESSGFGDSWAWTVFENNSNPILEIVPNPDPSGINTSSTVAKFTALMSGSPWAGCETMHGAGIGTYNITSSNSIITIMVYKTKISDVGIKLVTNSNASLGEIKVPNTLINQWEQLTFDFSAHIGGMTYDQLVVFPDFIARNADDIIYFDNIWGNDTTCSATNSIINVSNCVSYITPSGNVLMTSGNYQDTILNSSGCDSIMSINLTINTVDNSTSQDGVMLSSNALVSAYKWLDCDKNYAEILGEVNQFYSALLFGNYAVEVTTNGCTDTSDCINVVSSGINDFEFNKFTEVYPNPSNGVFTISSDLVLENIQVYDLFGQLALTTKSNQNITMIDLSHLKNGIYILKADCYELSLTRKIIKQ